MKNYVLFILSGINIFLALPSIILKIKKGKEVSFLVGLLFAILGYYFRPVVECDIARYYSYFFNEATILSFYKYGKDLYAKSLIYYLYYSGLSKYFLGFISAFITYYFLNKSYFMEKTIGNIRRYNLFYYFVFITSIPILGYTGIRFYPALALFIYGIELFFQNRKSYIIYLILSIFIHFGMMIPLSVFIIYRFLGKYISIKTLKILCIIAFIIGSVLDGKVLNYLVLFINTVLGKEYFSQIYITGEYGENFFKSTNIIGIITGITFIYSRKLILLLYVYFIEKRDKKIKYNLCLIILVLLLQGFRTPAERYFFVVYPLIIFSSLKNIILKNNTKLQIFFLIILFHNLSLMFFQIMLFLTSYISSYQNIFKLGWINIFLDNLNL